MPLLSWLSQDLRHAVRSLRRTPAVTLAAVATLALAIGANTAIFSLYQAVLLRRLPVESPEQLYFVAHGQAAPLSTSSHYPWFERVRSHTEVFAGATAYNIRDFKVSSGEGVEIVVGQYASGNYHALVGAPLQLGRGFTVEDDRVVNPIAVISDDYWTRQFGRSPDVLGKTFTVGNQPVTIVGVTAPQFHGMQPGRSIDITLPMSVQIQDDPEFITRTDTWTSMPLVVRLKAGARSRPGSSDHRHRVPGVHVASGESRVQSNVEWRAAFGHASVRRSRSRPASAGVRASVASAHGDGGCRPAHRVRQSRQPSVDEGPWSSA